MMGKLTFGRHAAKQLVAQIDISQKKFYILFIKVDTPKYAKYGQICIAYLGIFFFNKVAYKGRRQRLLSGFFPLRGAPPNSGKEKIC